MWYLLTGISLALLLVVAALWWGGWIEARFGLEGRFAPGYGIESQAPGDGDLDGQFGE